MKSIIILALSTLTSLVAGQASPPMFTGMNWSAGFVQGMTYTITWTPGDGGLVSAKLRSGNWSQTIFANLMDSAYFWTVPAILPGNYSMALLDNGEMSDQSPIFQIYSPWSMTAANTTTTMKSPLCTAAVATTYVYYDTVCGCTKTAMAPGPTMATWTMNYTAPMMTTPTAAAPTMVTPTIASQFKSAAASTGAFSYSHLIAFALAVVVFAF